MTSWGKYAITAVRYNSEKTRIQQVERREVGSDTLSKPETKSRLTIVVSLELGFEYTTAVKSDSGNWEVGEDVHVVEIDGSSYIRTDRNDKEEDNLGDLPEF